MPALKMLEEGAMPRLSFKGRVFVENYHLAVPFHELLPVRDKGCCMMLPRLKLLRELL
ncbi:MAG: hypothetical protein OXG67_11615 [bacterium]|nr:hypothetical protein [bacterium]MCY3889609.1 hypothetical protein [bacterium]